ncbi:hypothetical protein CCACVL1_27742 [Corchorus capsularis]|uniref:HMG box domain-containing protein n=1 Tax=Corchorus capsularis TaxID=210143 RepID=A0A1R3G935_COCAP|nr:hypothetical protein CCACVL1_27742 [Corchorus capsularis]
MATKNKEKYMEEMEAYKQNEEEEAESQRKEEEEMMKLQKQEALQLLKKKEKTENIIKKTKGKRQEKKQQNSDPNKPRSLLLPALSCMLPWLQQQNYFASSFLLFSMETKKSDARVTRNKQCYSDCTYFSQMEGGLQELSEEEKNVWNMKAAEAMEAYKKELEEYSKSAAAATADQENQQQ